MRILAFALTLAACTSSNASPGPPASSGAAPAPSATAKPAPRAPAVTRYPLDRTHSPLDAAVVANLRSIAAKNPRLRKDVFAKVGDSVTQSDDFLRCFDKPKLVKLDAQAELASVVQRFQKSAYRPFQRESHAARIGWSAWAALSGAPSPLEREFRATEARFALVQFGTNDIENAKLHHFADKLFDVVDWIIGKGAIPILFTIMPRRDRKDAAIWVPRYNAVIRGIAQARRVPLVDYHREISRLPGAGLAKDGIHPTTYSGDLGRNACDLGKDGLRHGYNLRNLLALQALDRASRALENTLVEPAPIAAAAERVTELPFIDHARFATTRERSYRIELSRPASLRAMGFDRGGSTDLVLTGASGRKTAERLLEVRIDRGVHTLTLRAASGDAETLLVLLAD